MKTKPKKSTKTAKPERAELLIGCGSERSKRLYRKGNETWSGLVTLDINPDHKPDVVHDLMVLPLPFADNTFDEIHAYEVLEHTGQQGDWRFFFAQFMEFYRILKPDGSLFATCPAPDSDWAWGDPSHTRIVHPLNLTFLNQPEYTNQVGKTPMSDFRFVFSGDFEVDGLRVADGQTQFVLRAVKPSRITR